MNKDYPIVEYNRILENYDADANDLAANVNGLDLFYTNHELLEFSVEKIQADAAQPSGSVFQAIVVSGVESTVFSVLCPSGTSRHELGRTPQNFTSYGGGAPGMQSVQGSLTAVNATADWRSLRAFSVATDRLRVNLLLLDSILFDFSKVDRFEVPPGWNVDRSSEVDLLPSTSPLSSSRDERKVAILESQQQRDAILLSRDFRVTLETLVDEEQFTSYDLTRIIGVTRAMLSQWRDRPLEKVRHTSQVRMGRLIFAWKYWLQITEGDILGRYVRHTPEGSTASLLDLLSSNNDPTDGEIVALIDRLARYASEDRKAGVQRRRDVGGLPMSSYGQDLVLD
ncbi:MAG: hypothetical protein LWW81_11270 [Rhodocyclales bacterium]|nr:hypothetical protein [Rhodocyclales bacterium]